MSVLVQHVICDEIRQCYNDVNVCLWTNGLALTGPGARTACQQNGSFLPRITNSYVQSKLAQFRSYAGNLLGTTGFWIDTSVTGHSSNFHWIDGSALAGRSPHVYLMPWL